MGDEAGRHYRHCAGGKERRRDEEQHREGRHCERCSHMNAGRFPRSASNLELFPNQSNISLIRIQNGNFRSHWYLFTSKQGNDFV